MKKKLIVSMKTRASGPGPMKKVIKGTDVAPERHPFRIFSSRPFPGWLLTFCLLVPLILASLCQDLLALESHVLDNGLEVFLQEDPIVPLTTIRITFRAGAIVETPEINGLCHLYEHLLFKGNSRYRDQAQFKAALKRMGTGSWNGGTSTEYVTYYITIPSSRIEDGLEFWAYAVETPLLRQDELVKERRVVHNEIAGRMSEPDYKLRQAVLHALYPEYWYRRDVSGDLKIIDTATVKKLKFIKNNYYVPNNAALFIAGDIDPDEVMNMVKKYYGGWEPGPGFPSLPPHRPLKSDLWVAVDNSPHKGLASVSFTFRGPDTSTDTFSTYGADIWSQMVNDPEGRFRKDMFKAVPELYGETRHISAGYFTQRDGGTSSFSFVLRVPPEKGLWEIITRLKKTLVEEVSEMNTPGYFSQSELEAAKTEIENHDLLSRETATGFMSNLSFWWASTSTDYYLGYLKNIRKSNMQDVHAFLAKYLIGKHFLTSIWLNMEDDKIQGICKRVKEMKK